MTNREKDKIILVVQSLRTGGAERYMTGLANALSKSKKVFLILEDDIREIEVNPDVSICVANKTQFKKSLKLSMACSAYSIIKKIGRFNKFERDLGKYIYWRGSSEKIWNLIEDIGTVDVISMMTDINIKLLMGAKRHNNHLFPIHCNAPQDIDASGKELTALVERYYPMATKVVMPTESMKVLFPKNIQEKTVIIANPLPNGLPSKYNGVRKKRIVNFCRLSPVKNIPMLFEAFKKFHINHPDYYVEIFGNGEEKEKLLSFIKEHHLEEAIYLRPFNSNIHECIVDSTMYVSTSNYEAFSNSVLEAMAIGIPVIATDCPSGGSRAMITNGVNGLLIPVGDVDSLYHAMIYIAENGVEAEKMANEAIKVRDEYSQENIADQFLNMLI